jgi:hypothetical protein
MGVSTSAPPINNRRRRGNSQGPLAIEYARSLADPFDVAPPRLGYGSLIPLSKSSMFLRSIISTAAGTPYNMFVVGGAVNQMLAVYPVSTAGTAFSAASPSYYNAANMTSIGSRFQTARVVTGGTRLRVINAATTVPPILFGGLIFDSLSNLLTLTPVQLTSQDQMRPISNVNNSLEVLYRPSDLSDFNLSGGVVNASAPRSATQAYPYLVFYVQGAVSFATILESIFHIEGNSGVDVVGEDESDSLADELANVESAYRTIIPLIGNTPVHDLVVSSPSGALEAAITMAARRSLSLRSEGGLVSASSSSSWSMI